MPKAFVTEKMTITKELFEQIEAYLRNTMTQEERQTFEQAISQNAALKNELELQSKLMTGIEKEGLKETLDEIFEDKFGHSVKKKNVIRLNAMKVAASLAILVVAAWLVFQELTPAHKALYSKYFQPPTGLPTLLGTDNDTVFEEGMVAYKLGEYEKAGQIWASIATQMPENDTLDFYLAANYLSLGIEKEAIPLLKQIAENEKSQWNNSAKWYLALACLKTGEPGSARKWLEELANQEGSYKEKAEKILERM